MLTKINRYEKDLTLYLQMLKNREERYINIHGASMMLELSENEVKYLCNENIIKHKINNDEFYIKLKHLQKFLDDIKLLKQKHTRILRCLNKMK